MAKEKMTQGDFIEAFRTMGAAMMAKKFNMAERRIYERRSNIEKRLGIQITGPDHPTQTRHNIEHPGRLHHEIENGICLIESDQHFWPGVVTTAHRAFIKFCKDMKPDLVISNGDAFDGSTISRHAPIGWEKRPSVVQELETCQERHGEIEAAAGKARKIWNLGNHCARFETRLATVAPEYAKVHGVHLNDHFPYWESAWSTWINNEVVVKHRFKNGIHATHNNVIWAGKTTVTGHLHSLKVTPFTDYNDTKWGVDCGTAADIFGPQFEYLEDNPRSWRSGFAVLTFWKGKLLDPELVRVMEEGKVVFRGQVIEV